MNLRVRRVTGLSVSAILGCRWSLLRGWLRERRGTGVVDFWWMKVSQGKKSARVDGLIGSNPNKFACAPVGALALGAMTGNFRALSHVNLPARTRTQS